MDLMNPTEVHDVASVTPYEAVRRRQNFLNILQSSPHDDGFLKFSFSLRYDFQIVIQRGDGDDLFGREGDVFSGIFILKGDQGRSSARVMGYNRAVIRRIEE